MSSTSKKHRYFTAEPMGNKSVTELAGIGDTLGGRLKANGYSRADSVVGQYLLMRGDRKQFSSWLTDVTGANSKQAQDCYRCVDDWCQNFM
uniref:Barrier-to-autointegration factor-like protein n=1 Tax=Amblyomma maculatum TaxID=34609 RepID=G3MN83_AMBMU